jgi:hypothetical protein
VKRESMMAFIIAFGIIKGPFTFVERGAVIFT